MYLGIVSHLFVIVTTAAVVFAFFHLYWIPRALRIIESIVDKEHADARKEAKRQFVQTITHMPQTDIQTIMPTADGLAVTIITSDRIITLALYGVVDDRALNVPLQHTFFVEHTTRQHNKNGGGNGNNQNNNQPKVKKPKGGMAQDEYVVGQVYKINGRDLMCLGHDLITGQATFGLPK
jgi:hypothetical protein